MSLFSRRLSDSGVSGRHATAGGAIASERSSRIEIPEPTLGETVWELLSPLLWKLLVFYIKIFLLIASLVLFVVTTVLLYSVIYWLAVPKRLHTYPVYFSYKGAHSDACANITLADRQWEAIGRPIKEWDRPTPGFDFDISISLEYPGTVPREPVMFETSAMLRDHHTIVKTERPFLPTQISWLGTLFRDFVTMAFTGLHLYKDKQTADVMLVESLPVFAQEQLSYVHVCMHKPPLHVYSATLNFVSKLSGFRYMLAHHPVLVGAVVVGSIVGLAFFAVAVAYAVRYFRPREEIVEEEEEYADEPLSPVSPREEELLTSDAAGEDAGSGLRRRIVTS